MPGTKSAMGQQEHKPGSSCVAVCELPAMLITTSSRQARTVKRCMSEMGAFLDVNVIARDENVAMALVPSKIGPQGTMSF